MREDFAVLRGELVTEEGDKPTVYLDIKGVPTFGIGHNGRKPIRPEAVDLIFVHDIEDAESDLDVIQPRWREFDLGRQRVLINLCFNVGRAGFAEFKRFWASALRYLETHDKSYLQVGAAELLDSDAARELPKRYERLAQRWIGNVVS